MYKLALVTTIPKLLRLISKRLVVVKVNKVKHKSKRRTWIQNKQILLEDVQLVIEIIIIVKIPEIIILVTPKLS